MNLVTLTLLFLFCCGNVGAYGANKDSEDIAKKTKVMMDDIDKILKDFYRSIQENHRTSPNEGKISHEMKHGSYDEPAKAPGKPLNNSGLYKSDREKMKKHYDLQDRYAELQQHLRELKKLNEEWVNNKRDRALYEKYADEKEKYTQALNAYKQDLKKHKEMKKMTTRG
jgi:hypothetical protein